MTRDHVLASCPAKINLSLEILGRRPDGYHELRTVFQTIDLHDDLEVLPGPEVELTCSGTIDVPTGPANLVVRAAESLRRRFDVRSGATLRLVKRIPVGAGLGGGSADAAGAIVALDQLWQLRTTLAERLEVAAELGADVPFFLYGGRALGSGRGDHLARLEVSSQLVVLLGVPPFQAATSEVFGWWAGRLTPQGKDVRLRRLLETRESGLGSSATAVNDLEAVAFVRWPVLRRFRDGLLDHGASAALLSGSGSSVYGVFDTQDSRDRAARALGARFPDWNVVKTRSVSHGVRIVRPI